MTSEEDAPEDVPKVVKQFFELIVKQWFYIRDDDLESFKISILNCMDHKITIYRKGQWSLQIWY